METPTTENNSQSQLQSQNMSVEALFPWLAHSALTNTLQYSPIIAPQTTNSNTNVESHTEATTSTTLIPTTTQLTESTESLKSASKPLNTRKSTPSKIYLQRQFDVILFTLKRFAFDKVLSAESLSISPRQLSSQIIFLRSNNYDILRYLPPWWELDDGLSVTPLKEWLTNNNIMIEKRREKKITFTRKKENHGRCDMAHKSGFIEAISCFLKVFDSIKYKYLLTDMQIL